MGKLSPFKIIHFANVLSLFPVLSPVHQTRISLPLSVWKAVS